MPPAQQRNTLAVPISPSPSPEACPLPQGTAPSVRCDAAVGTSPSALRVQGRDVVKLRGVTW